MLVLPNGTKLSEGDASTIMTLQKQVSKSEPGTTEAVTRLSNVGNQLIHWPSCIPKKPAFMLIHEFMQRWTQLFSYLDSGYFHQTMELPTAQEKSKQIFFVQLKGTSVQVQRRT
jgi:hypothetical protein